MIVRKNMGRAKSLLMLLMVFGFSFATYNLVSMIIDHKAGGYGLESFDGKVMGFINTHSKFHVAVTATDAAYSQWQCRIMYYWYKKIMKELQSFNQISGPDPNYNDICFSGAGTHRLFNLVTRKFIAINVRPIRCIPSHCYKKYSQDCKGDKDCQ